MAALKIAKKLVSIANGTTKTASDGNQYRWLGAQWAKVGKSGKAGQMARRGIAAELTSSESGKRVSKSKHATSNQSKPQNILLVFFSDLFKN